MPVKHAIWRVGEKPSPLVEISLETEALLETMIVEDPSMLSDGWMLIGQQVRTAHAGFVDLLALHADGQVIIIELRPSQTPREVVAQALDYASWAETLESDAIAEIYQRFSKGRSLSEAFTERFGIELDEDQLNGSHHIAIVASTLDPSTERIVNYLSGRDVPINVISFQVFQSGSEKLLRRTWLIDPAETESKAAPARASKGEWNGEYYVAFGHDHTRHWDDGVRFRFHLSRRQYVVQPDALIAVARRPDLSARPSPGIRRRRPRYRIGHSGQRVSRNRRADIEINRRGQRRHISSSA